MKLTINQTNNTVSSVTDTRIVQNSSGINYVYIYGVASGQVVKCTFRKPDGNLVGPINSVYDVDADSVACFVCIIPSTALTLAGDIGVSVAVYSAPFWQASIISYWTAHGTTPGTYDIGPSKALADLPTAPSVETAARVNTGTAETPVYEYYVSKVNIQTTVRSTGFIYSSDTVEFPDELATEITDDLYARYNNIIAGNVSLDALDVTGNAAIGGTLGVTGNASFGNIAASGYFAGASETLSGSLTVGTNFIANGSASIGTTLLVGGATQINGGANFASGVNIIGNATVRNVAINGASSHVGNATFGNISASGAIVGASVTSNAAINGASLNLSADLGVAGNAVINGSLTVIGESNLATCIISGDNLDVNNNKIVNVANGSADGDAVNIGQLAFSLGYKQDVSEKDQPNGYAGLNSAGKLAGSVVPAVAIVDTFEVADVTAMLALSTAEKSDVAIVADPPSSYILSGTYDPSVLENWKLLKAPTDTVLSVNGETGVVTLDAADIATDQVGQTIQDALDILEQDAVDIATIEAEQTTQNGRLTAAEADIVTVQGTVNALVTTSTGMQDLLARQQPTTELSLATPTTAIARKVANINRFHFKGLTIKNLVKNGNFVNTANWTSNLATFSVSNNRATITGNGTGIIPLIQNSPFSTVSGNVYYYSFYAQNSVSTNGLMRFSGGTAQDISLTFSTSDTRISGLFTSVSAHSSFYIGALYSDSATANGKVLILHDVAIVNLTALGTHPSGVHWHDMTASQIDAFIGNLDTTSQIVAKAQAGGETNKVTNGTFATDTTGWSVPSGSLAVSDGYGVRSVTSIAANSNYSITQNAILTVGKTYYVSITSKVPTYDGGGTISFAVGDNVGVTPFVALTLNTAATNTFVFTAQGVNFSAFFRYSVLSANSASMGIDNVVVYDITSYYRTADLISFAPLNITCFDGTTTLSTALASALNPSASLPDGQADEFDFYVEDDPADADFQSRMMERTRRTLRIDLPNAQVGGVDKWQLGKVGTTAARFFCRLEDLAIASGHTILGATRCFRANLPTSSGWFEYDDITYKVIFRTPLTAGLETWAANTVPTILLKAGTGMNLLSYDALMADDSAIGYAIDAASEYLYIASTELSLDLGELYTYLGSAGAAVSVVIPYDTYGANVENIYTSHLAYALSTFNDHCADAAGICYYEDYDNDTHYISLKLPVATADTLAELYTYLVANPLSLIVEIADEVSDITQSYVKQTGNALTLAITSNSAVQAGAFDATVATDINLILAAL